MTRLEHLLVCLIEECSEVQKEASKALRFGITDKYKERKRPCDALSQELVDLFAVVDMLEEEEDSLFNLRTSEFLKMKKDKVEKYILYSKNRGR